MLRPSFVLLAVFGIVLAGCRGAQESPRLAGAVVFVDAAGNRMLVDNRGAPAAVPETPPVNETPTAQDLLPKRAFGGDEFVDSDALMRELEQKESQRFYVIPDGTGGKQMLEAGTLGVGVAAPVEPQQPAAAATWRVCRVILPLITLKPADRHDLRFPAEDFRGTAHAGFRLRAPEGASKLQIETFVRSGKHAMPVLARLDGEGRVLSIVNNMPTQSIPESVFRYASLVSTTELVAGGGRDYAVLDASRLQGRLPPGCGLQAGVQLNEQPGAGQVTVQFSGSGEE